MAARVSIGDEYVGLKLKERFKLLRGPIQGGFSLVFRAETMTPRKGEPAYVAVKILRPDLRGPLSDGLIAKLEDYFNLEIEALGRARHEHIVRLIGHGTALARNGQPFRYQLLEYMSGGMLEERCRRAPLSMSEALDFLEQLILALAEAHRLGYIHRDLKPENFLLTADGETVKLADFGAARLEGDVKLITAVGTAVYSPPEHSPMLAGMSRGALTPASDIYALAKSFYRMVCGERPHDYSGRPLTAWPASVAHEPWAGRLLRVLNKATQDDPAARHQSTAEFLAEVHGAVGAAARRRPAGQRRDYRALYSNASGSAATRNARMLWNVALAIIISTSVALMCYGAWHLRSRKLQGGPAKYLVGRVKLEALAERDGDISGVIATPPDGMKVNLREQAGVSRRIRCVISSRGQVRTLGGLKILGDNLEKWFEVEVTDPGDGGEYSCQPGHRGWAYGKVLLTL